MTRNLFALLEAKLVETVIGDRPTLPGHGVSIMGWRTNEFCGALAAIMITGDAAATISSPTGGSEGIELWGYRLTRWWRITELRDGREIDVDVTVGYAQQANVIGIFERLAVAGTVSAGTAVAKLAPIESWG